MSAVADQLDSEVRDISLDRSPEWVAELIERVDRYIERGKQLKEALDTKLMEYILGTGQDIVIGPVRYYVGCVRETKCRDRAECLRTLLEVFGPEHVGRQFLSSGAFRHGAIGKEVDAETFGRLFETRERTEVREGKAERVRRLVKVDERFVH